MKTSYATACASGWGAPLFSQSWWLDAVLGASGWDVALVENGEGLVASMPYAMGKRMGFRVSLQPPLTQTLGPWFKPSSAKSARALAQQKKWMEALIAQLPAFAKFSQNWHYTQRNWLPFHWRGFQQTTRYTYVLEDLSDLERVWDGMDQNIRTDIRKASARFGLRMQARGDIDDFLSLNGKVFERQGKTLPYTASLVRRLHEACVERNACRLFIAEDEFGRKHAGVFLVWDRESAYYLLGGGDPELRSSGATSLCLWEAIQFAAKVTKRFDFEGSMLEPVERFFRAFGAQQTPYFQVSRIGSRTWAALEAVRSLRARGR